MALSPATSSKIEVAAVGGEMESTKLIQFLHESFNHEEDFVTNLYTDWCHILESNCINETVRVRCDSWFKMCCDYRSKNKNLAQQGLNKIKGGMEDKLYTGFTEMVEGLLEEDDGPSFKIEILALNAAKDVDRATWIENCFCCVEQEDQLVTKYTKIPDPMEQDTAGLSQLEGLYSKCTEQETLLVRELSRLETETNRVQGLVHEKLLEESKLADLETVLHYKGELIGGAGKEKVQKIQQSVLKYKQDMDDKSRRVESLKEQVLKQMDVLYIELLHLVEGLSEQLDGWRRQHTLAYVELGSHENLAQVASWTFVVTEQCGCILKTDKKTWSKVTVRMLGADNTSILEKKVKVHCMFVNEEDINAYYHDDILDIEGLKVKQHKLNNCEANFAKPTKTGERQSSCEFKKLQLVNGRVERGNSQKQVHEEKYRLVFFTDIDTVTNTDTHTYWTMSLPLVVNTGANQGCHCLASVMWQCYSTDVYKLPLENKERLPWSEVAAMLGAKIGKLHYKRTLTDDNLRHLKMRLLGSDSAEDGQNEEVTLKQFCIEKLDKIGDTDRKCDFSFWKWFLSCYNLIEKYLLDYWRDGLIDGFLSKKMAERKLTTCGSHKNGLFLLRFSDGHITDSQGLSSMFGILCTAVSFMRVHEGQNVWDIRHLDTAPHSKLKDQNLANILRATNDTHNQQILKVHLSSMRRREDVFDKFCENGVIVEGYQGVTDAFIVDLEQWLAKIKIETGKHLSSSCDTPDECYGNKRIKSNSENGKPTCQKVAGSRSSRSSSAADHPTLSMMLNSPTLINEETTQGPLGTQVTRKLMTLLSPRQQIPRTTQPPPVPNDFVQQQQLQQQQFQTIRMEDMVDDKGDKLIYANRTTSLSQLPSIAQSFLQLQNSEVYDQNRAYENISPANDVATVSSSTSGVGSPDPISESDYLPFIQMVRNPLPGPTMQSQKPATNQQNWQTTIPDRIDLQAPEAPMSEQALSPTYQASNQSTPAPQQQVATSYQQPQYPTTVPVSNCSNMMSQQQAGTTFLQSQCPVSQQVGSTFIQPQFPVTVPVSNCSNMMSQQQAGTTFLQFQCPMSQQVGTTFLQPQCPVTVQVSNCSNMMSQQQAGTTFLESQCPMPQQVGTTFLQPQCPTTVPVSNTMSQQQVPQGEEEPLLLWNTLKRCIDALGLSEAQIQQLCLQHSTTSQQKPMLPCPQGGNHSVDDLVTSSDTSSSTSAGSLPRLQDSDIDAANELTSGDIDANMLVLDTI